jgi:hypothetical protein
VGSCAAKAAMACLIAAGLMLTLLAALLLELLELPSAAACAATAVPSATTHRQSGTPTMHTRRACCFASVGLISIREPRTRGVDRTCKATKAGESQHTKCYQPSLVVALPQYQFLSCFVPWPQIKPKLEVSLDPFTGACVLYNCANCYLCHPVLVPTQSNS